MIHMNTCNIAKIISGCYCGTEITSNNTLMTALHQSRNFYVAISQGNFFEIPSHNVADDGKVSGLEWIRQDETRFLSILSAGWISEHPARADERWMQLTSGMTGEWSSWWYEKIISTSALSYSLKLDLLKALIYEKRHFTFLSRRLKQFQRLTDKVCFLSKRRETELWKHLLIKSWKKLKHWRKQIRI